MAHNLLIDSTDLVHWSDRTESQSQLPHLVRSLIIGTVPKINRIDIAAGEGVALPGYDGVLNVDAGNAWVPDGISVWEMGTTKDKKGKADDDYEKRKAEPGDEVDPDETTFVFVTSRRWREKERKEWINARLAEVFWKDVRVITADDLDLWFASAPDVHIAISRQLGKYPGAVTELASFWTEWAGATVPPIPPELLLAGRRTVAEDIVKSLNAGPSVMSVGASTREEATAVLAASVQLLGGPDRERMMQRSVVVKSEESWRTLELSSSPLILVPLFDDRSAVYGAVTRGHHVYVPLANDEAKPSVDLPPISHDEAVEALRAAGMNEEQSRLNATLARRSMTTLRRRLSTNPELQAPAWAAPADCRTVLPFVLAGKWVDSPGDRSVLEKLAKKSYDELDETFARLASVADSPIRKTGGVSFMVSRGDSWELVSRIITNRDLEVFEEACLDTFLTVDPTVGMSEAERLAASLRGKVLQMSGHLRGGLAETLALLGARSSSTIWLADSDGQTWANRIVWKLLDAANKDTRIWGSFAAQLPLFAEASPERFLEAVERSLRSEAPGVLNLFTDNDDDLLGSSPHVHLLWALETLAWHPDHLGRVAVILAELARREPGGKLVNRPSQSLRDIFLGWRPQTAAPSTMRLRAVDALRRNEPAAAWSLIIAMLPDRHEVSTANSRPEFRDWNVDPIQTVTVAEYLSLIREVVARAVEDAVTDGERWAQLVAALVTLPETDRNTIMTELSGLDLNELRDKERAVLWRTLRSTINRHREFAYTDWAMPAIVVDQLVEIYERLAPADSIDRYAYLFDYGVELLNPPDRRTVRPGDRNLLVEPLRDAALNELYEEGRIARIIEAVDRVPNASNFGFIVGRNPLFDGQILDILEDHLASEHEKNNHFAQGVVQGVFARRQWEWAEALLAENASRWPPDKIAIVVGNLPFGERAWDMLDSLHIPDAESAYWRKVANTYATGIDFIRAAQKYLEHGNPLSAVLLLAHQLHDRAAEVPADLALEAMDSLIHAVGRGEAQLVHSGYEITELMKHLQGNPGLDQSRVATLEWLLFRLMESFGGRPTVLYRELSSNPEFFVELIKSAFTRKSSEDSEKFDPAKSISALELLWHWRSCPGELPDGTLDRDVLNAWVMRVREIIVGTEHEVIGDQQIGQALAQGPEGTDGVRPHEHIRELIESLRNPEVEKGYFIRTRNNRGSTWRSLTEGGVQERELANRFREDADDIGGEYPRAAAVLREIAAAYDTDARRQDASANLTADMMN